MSVSHLPKWNHENYYGAFDENNKPKQGLAYFMLQEHIEQLMEKEKKKVIREMYQAIESFKNIMEIQLKNKLKEVDRLSESLVSLRLYVNNLVKENTLKDPRLKR